MDTQLPNGSILTKNVPYFAIKPTEQQLTLNKLTLRNKANVIQLLFN